MTAGELGLGENGISPTDKQKRAVDFISSQPYWSRTWIVQEIMLASDITIIVGNYTFPWSRVAKLGPQSIQSSLWHQDSHGLPLMNMTFVEGQMRFGQRSAMLGLLERKTKWESQVALDPDEEKSKTYVVPCYVAFGTFAEHACSDPRDNSMPCSASWRKTSVKILSRIIVLASPRSTELLLPLASAPSSRIYGIR